VVACAALVGIFLLHVALAATPVVSNVQTVVVGPYEAQIGWTTDIAADSVVMYGMPTTPSSSVSNSNMPCSSNNSDPTTSHCVDIGGLLPNTLYYYQVTSCVSGVCGTGSGSFITTAGSGGSNSTSTSGTSTSTTGTATSTTGTDTTPPTMPPSITSYAVTSTAYQASIHIYWSPSSDNAGVAGYKLYKNSNFIANVSTTYYIDYSVSSGNTYNYYVIAYDAAGNVSSPSGSTTATLPVVTQTNSTSTTTTSTSTTSNSTTTVPIPATPSNLRYSLSNSNMSVSLSWNDNSNNETRFEIYRQLQGGTWAYLGMTGANLTSFLDTSTHIGGYYYMVAACNGATVNTGCSMGSNAIFASVTGNTSTTTTTATTTPITSTTTPTPTTTIAIATTTPITLTASKTITGTAAFTNGQPVTDAQVGAYSVVTRQWVSTFTDSNGRFSLSVSGGTWQVGITPRNSATATWSSPGTYPQVTFIADNSFETQAVNFSIVAPGAKLSIQAVDQNGSPITQATIIVDTVSVASQPTSTTGSTSASFKNVDASGTAIFSLQGGTYYVRAYLPSSLGYFNPDEKSISINSGDAKSLSLVFQKQTTAATAVLSGVTTLNDGTPVSAFVWAWSEDGKTAQATSDGSGNFSFPVTNGRWHIGAGKTINDYPYQSSNLTVDIAGANATVAVVLSQSGNALSPSVTVANQSSAQTITASAQDGASVTIPSGASTASGPLSVTVAPTVEVPSQAGAKVVSTAYDVTLTTAVGTAITSFSKDIAITLPYNAADLAAQKISPSKLVPSYFDEKSGTWIKVDNYFVDTVHNVVVIHVNHLTRFALIAAADIAPPPAPQNITATASGSGVISIAWTNPASDFDHIKIYRSTTAGNVGKILADNVLVATASDMHVVDGTTYYYTVVAVDPVGNESTNLAQVAVKARGTSAGGSVFSRALRLGSRGSDVSTLQTLLVKEGVYPAGIVSGYFGKLTQQAVIAFQEKYQNDVLAPYGLAHGTGIVGIATRAKLNQLSQ